MIVRLCSQTLQAALTLLALLAGVFLAARAAGQASAEQIAPFLERMVMLDFGRSLTTQEPVLELVGRHMRPTLALAGVSILVLVVIAFPFTVGGARRRGGGSDGLGRLICALGQTVPAFWLGILLAAGAALQLRLVPGFGQSTWKSFVLPVLVQAMLTGATIMWLLRGTMLRNLNTEFVQLARARGLSAGRVAWRHSLRNALAPVLGLGPLFVSLFAGSLVLTETVFEWPGLGLTAYQAISRHDYPVVQGIVVLGCMAVVAASLVMAVFEALANPRLRT
jgi:peptide/nickel transport system permease protein